MSLYNLFVSPGIAPGDEAAAKARFEGEDERSYLDQARIRQMADELMREHGLSVSSEDEEDVADPGTPRGIELQGAGAPDVRVDGWGVTITAYAGESQSATLDAMKGALAVARTASRLLGGAVYDTERGRIVAAGEPDLASEAAEVYSQSTARSARSRETLKRARVAMILLVLIPTVGLNLARRYLSGLPLFLVVFGALIAAALLTRRWIRKPRAEDAPALPARPIRPS